MDKAKQRCEEKLTLESEHIPGLHTCCTALTIMLPSGGIESQQPFHIAKGSLQTMSLSV